MGTNRSGKLKARLPASGACSQADSPEGSLRFLDEARKSFGIRKRILSDTVEHFARIRVAKARRKGRRRLTLTRNKIVGHSFETSKRFAGPKLPHFPLTS